MKKLISLLLSLAMVFSLAMPAMAAEPTITGGTEGEVKASYAPSPATITGVSLSGNGVTYDESTKTYTVSHDATDIVLTVHGFNLQDATDNNYVEYALGVGIHLTDGDFEIGNDGTTATLIVPVSDFKISSNYEIRYNNDYLSGGTLIYTGIYVTYDVGVSEEDKAVISSISITVDGKDYTSGNVTVYSDSEVVLTINGTNLQNGTADTYVMFAEGYCDPLSSTSFSINEEGTIATQSLSISVFQNCNNFEIYYTYDFFNGGTNYNTGIFVTYNAGTKPVTYTVTVNESDNGTVEADKSAAAKDEVVTLTVTPAAGYELDALTVNDGAVEVTKVNATTYTFVMPEGNVTVTATFKVITYAVNIDENVANGTVSVDKSAAAEGETVTVTVEADAEYAYVVNSLKVINDSTGLEVEVNEEYKTFVMPASSVTVTAEFEQLDTTSADIEWGSLAYTYTDEAGAWTADTADKAGQITVTNTGSEYIDVTVVYTAKEGYEDLGVTGSFDLTNATVAEGSSKTFTLELSGKPKKALSGETIGTVTVTIEKHHNTNTEFIPV